MDVLFTVYEERYKSACKRVLGVLKDNGLHPSLAARGGKWQVEVPQVEFERARVIVWGDPNEAEGR